MRRKLSQRDDSGFTLVELALVVVTVTILFGMSVPIINTLFDASTRVNNTYKSVNQLLPVSTNLQQLMRAAVSPAPPSSSTGLPVPAFLTGSVSQTSVTFYSNIGDPNGPAMITASCAPVVNALCANPSTFTVTEARAVSNCPFNAATTTCTFTSSPTKLITVNGVTNSSIFAYTLLIATYTTNSNGTVTTSYQPQAVTANDPVYNYSIFNSCTTGTQTVPLKNCGPAEIQSVAIDLQVNSGSGRTAGDQSEDSTTVYLLSNSSSNYQPMVG